MDIKKLQWVIDMKDQPKLIAEALKYLGIKEIAGIKSNPVILGFAKKLGVSNIYDNDDVAWCALLICYLCVMVSKPMPYNGYDCLRAKSFVTWGNAVLPGEEMYGDILVFERPEGFHVAICIAVTNTTFIVLGGNQSNTVCFTEIAKDRLYAARRYYSIAPPSSVKRY